MNKELAELQTKLEWMTKKRWALEMALANISTMNSCFISSSSDETVRGTHRQFSEVVSRSIEQAGGITVYVDWGKDDFSSDIPAFNPKKTLKDMGEL